MGNPFEGYQPGGPVPGRPWWRLQFVVRRVYLRRDDGRRVLVGCGDALQVPDLTAAVLSAADVDAAHPHPCPPPMVGQVWRDPSSPYTAQVMAITTALHLSDGTNYNNVDDWPIRDWVLVWGPGAPWGPPSYQPEEG
jgi:hypothetical protein